MPPSEALRNDISDHIFRDAAYAKPTQLHIGLFTASGEVSGFGYVRQQLNPGNANWARNTVGTITNAVQVTFPDPNGGPWGQIIETRLYDQNGSERMRAPLTAFRTVNQGDQGPIFPIGSLVFTIPG